MLKTFIDFTCQQRSCIELSTHGAILDDRWYEQQFPTGTYPGWTFKPKELLLGCPEHFIGIIHRSLLTFCFNSSDHLITAEREDEWLKEIEKGELVVHGKFS